MISKSLNSKGPRCKSKSDQHTEIQTEDDQCPRPNQIYVENDFEIIRNENLQKSNLIQPQEIELKLRPGIPQEISFTIGQSVDYPVDLYFLFDLSFSMNASRNTFAEQSKNIISRHTLNVATCSTWATFTILINNGLKINKD